MTALVVGGDGLLGTALVKALKAAGVEVDATTRRVAPGETRWGPSYVLDLANPNTWQVPFQRYDVLYLVAAITKVVDCEADPATAWRINADGPVGLAQRFYSSAPEGSWPGHVVFVSSDAVERAPNLIYSRTKAYVESFVLATRGTVVRPSRIPPDHVDGLAALLVRLGESRGGGLHRWSPL